jgi:hypothetical protein
VNRGESGSAAGAGPVVHEVRTVRRREGGGFTIEPAGGPGIDVLPAGDGWMIEGPEAVSGWRLTRGESCGRRFLLVQADGRTEAGRSSCVEGFDDPATPRDLAMADGRVFRVVLRGPGDARFELSGWETRGSYLTARPVPEGWTIVPEPASSGLREIGPLLILFAAEILRTEDNREDGAL